MLKMRRCWLVAAVAVASWAQAGLAATQSEKEAVQDYLLARGEFPDDLSVTGGIEVEMNYDNTQQVGRFFNLYPQIKDNNGQILQGNNVELLVLHGGSSIVPFTLMRWKSNDDIDVSSVVGEWRGERLVFASLFLTRDLPQGSRLAVLVRNKPHGSNKYRLETFPLASIAAKTSLTEPVTHVVLESDPPRAKWTLKFNRNITAHTSISWYVISSYGDRTAPTNFATKNNAADLVIMSQPHRTWEGLDCMALAVSIDSTDNCRDASCRSVMYHPPEVIAAPFGNCN